MQNLEEFYHNFHQELMAGAEGNKNFMLHQFMDLMTNELIDTGHIEGFEFCHYRAQRGLRVDGYWFDDDGNLTLFIADYDSREELISLTKTDVQTIFKRLTNFFNASLLNNLFSSLEDTSPEYDLTRQIADRSEQINKVEFFLLSERTLSERIQTIDDAVIAGKPCSFNVWDISRLERQRNSKTHKEALEIDFKKDFGEGLACLPAHLNTQDYKSYLAVFPGALLSKLYEKYSARLLEQNVRSFLQARSKINKGIRRTILTEPNMFFAYNNGITATANEVEVEADETGLKIVKLVDFQIVNGGQTTASLFHTQKKDKAELDCIFVQMKLSVIQNTDEIVPKISEYANTQNRVNASDFFSNHPFHIRIEEFSRRIWAPAQGGSLRETKWFYERARGQYADAQSKLSPSETKKFKAEYPKPQMFTKTDLAKYENVWEEHPKYVNLGAQKNFAHFASNIGQRWEKSSDNFNEHYFKCLIAKAIIFKSTEKLVSAQSWYQGGYRANIVTFTIALLSELARSRSMAFDFLSVWNTQTIPVSLEKVIARIAKYVSDQIHQPPTGISNISEWCKKDGCWENLKANIHSMDNTLDDALNQHFISTSTVKSQKKDAVKTQKIDDGIIAQKTVLNTPTSTWFKIFDQGNEKNLFTDKELDIISIAKQIPNKIPTEKQSFALIEILEKAKLEGLVT